jgi:Cytidylate kinase-like family
MSIVAISETAGSMGIEIGRKLAESLGWEFADREILSKASEQFGENVTDLRRPAFVAGPPPKSKGPLCSARAEDRAHHRITKTVNPFHRTMA